jgi:hypothetical protein
MLEPAGFFDRIPALDVRAPGGTATQNRHECMSGG